MLLTYFLQNEYFYFWYFKYNLYAGCLLGIIWIILPPLSIPTSVLHCRFLGRNVLDKLCLDAQPNKMYDKPGLCPGVQLFEWPHGILFVRSNIREPHKTGDLQIFCPAAFTTVLINCISKEEVSTMRPRRKHFTLPQIKMYSLPWRPQLVIFCLYNGCELTQSFYVQNNITRGI